MSKNVKGMIAAIIALAATAAFLLGMIIPNADPGKVSAETKSPQDETIETTQAQTDELIVKDSAGNEFKAPLEANSVIALNPNSYEMLSALGKKELVSGTGSDAKYPEDAAAAQKYGTESRPETEKIIEAAPDAVLVTTEFTKSDEYTKLKKAGIPVVALDLNKSDTAIEEVAKLGLLFDAYDNADGFITDIENINKLVSEKTAGKGEKKVYWELSGDYTSVNKDSNEAALIKSAAAKSITDDKTDANVKTDVAFIKEKAPDIIVKTNEYDSGILTLEKADMTKAKEVTEGIAGREGIDGLAAIKDKKILLLSERIINTPLGSAIAPLYIAKMAYPEEMKDVNPGDYLKSFYDKYWGADLKGALAYFANLSDEENKAVSGALSASGANALSSLSSLPGGSAPEGEGDASADPAAAPGSSSKNTLLAKAGLGTLSAAAANNSSAAVQGNDARSNLADKAGANAAPSGNTANQGNNSGNNQGNNQNQNKNTDSNVSRTDDGKIDVSDGNGPKEVVKDSKGEEIIVDKDDNTGETAVKRCIVFNSSVYEMIKALGQEKSVIGVAESLTELNPNVPTFGTWKEPNAEAVIEAKPDVVFAYANYGQEAVAKIKNAGIAVISLNLYVPSEIPEEIITLGKVLGAESVAEAFNADVAAVHDLIAQRTRYVSPVSAYWEGYTDYKTVGQGSGGGELMALAHVNSLTAYEPVDYPEISDEWILEKKPEVIVKMVSTSKNILGPTVPNYDAAKALYGSICARPGWSTIPAVTNKKMVLLDGTVGTTALGHAIAPLYIAKTAYPDKFSDVDADAITREIYSKYWGEALPGTWRYYEQ